MADKATGGLSASIFLDEVKSAINGVSNYEPASAIAASSGQGWVFAEVSVGVAVDADLLGTGNDYMGGISDVATGDKYKWLAVKNLSTTATEGVALSLDANASNAYNDVDAITIGAGEMVILKLGEALVSGVHARAVTMDGTYGYSTANASSGTVTCHVAAILENIG